MLPNQKARGGVRRWKVCTKVTKVTKSIRMTPLMLLLTCEFNMDVTIRDSIILGELKEVLSARVMRQLWLKTCDCFLHPVDLWHRHNKSLA
jgi:hypothetical protein